MTIDGRGSLAGWTTEPPPLHTTVPSDKRSKANQLNQNQDTKLMSLA